VGHRRTPWTVKYNPSNADIVASGDLAYEIRIWSISSGTCMYSAFLEFAIISLSFHPLGQCLAIASGTQIFFWDFHRQTAPIAAWTHHHTIRCVSFAPSDSHCLFVGAANGRRSEFTGDITFSLLSWEFDLENLSMKYPQVLLRRAILYNDGGFGISRCGRFICALAEFWRPAGMRAADPPDGVSAPSMQQHRKRQKRDELMSPSEDEWRASSGDSDGVMGRHNYWLYEEYWEMLYDGPDVPFQAEGDGATGEYITHIVKISLSLRYPGPVWAPGEALVVAARSLESYTSNEVTSVKFSPSSNFVIVGCGVMEVPRPIPSHMYVTIPSHLAYHRSLTPATTFPALQFLAPPCHLHLPIQ
jgi:WD40 repeat protein